MTVGTAPVLVLGVGNPSRGDDALGPRFLERIGSELAGAIAARELELLTDFQLQIEHALDLVGRRRVVFIDASVAVAPPFAFGRVLPRPDESATTHALAPSAVLATYQRVVGAPPESWLLAIRGERFELGEPLSDEATGNLAAALRFFLEEAWPTMGAP